MQWEQHAQDRGPDGIDRALCERFRTCTHVQRNGTVAVVYHPCPAKKEVSVGPYQMT